MTRSLRVSMFLALTLCVACSSLAPIAARADSIDARIIALLPPETTQLSGFDVARLQQTHVYRKWEELVGDRASQMWSELIEHTGVDPRRDLDTGVLAGWAPEGEHEHGQTFLMIAKGRFDTDAIGEKLAAEGAEIGETRGVKIYSGHRKHDESEVVDAFSTAFLDDGTIVAGPQAEVIAVIERFSTNGPSLAQKTEFAARAERVSTLGQYWAVSEAMALPAMIDLPEEVSQNQMRVLEILTQMKDSEMYIDMMSGFDIHIAGNCDSPEDAKNLADAARGMVALGRLTLTPETQDFMQVLDRVEIADSADEIRLDLRLDSDEVDRLFDFFESKQPVVADGI